MAYIKNKLIPAVAGLILIVAASCNKIIDTPDVTNPNGAELSTVLTNASRTQLQQLATGTFSAMRTGYNTNPGNGTSSYESYCKVTGTLGREVYVINSSETRWVNELAGLNGALDPGAFYNGYYFSFSNARQTAAIFQLSALNTNAINSQEKSGILGFTNTVIAFEMLHILNMQGKNGIRVDMRDYLNPGPFVPYDSGLAVIRGLLDTASAQLQAAGSAFMFTCPPGFSGFDQPSTFLQFNRAIAARVALYQRDWQKALSALNASYFDINGALSTGPVFNWGVAPDLLNPLYQPLGNAISVVANNAFVAEAEPGDARLNKVVQRSSALNLVGISGNYDVNLYSTNLTPVSIIRNEELILIYAECMIQLGQNSNAVQALNIIRTKAGHLGNYAGQQTKDALIDELLKQRRYSLFYEGHRWIDMRRYGRLTQLPIDQPGQTIFDAMPRPLAELNWGK
ncbi:RagB/SusD family nutrient uptake outer membrane protein [Chitinophaga flava]|uniref:RagB/SusD family nutrient uptake outer membrane protein n=1 Tax=Chitinophaga flava TaxID=2259036 RepID=A0A365Y184_9BACT|nr:RagB/SusD family nutrient uptake outer membrane protein [Chitinophaga flava]RBL92001.1 RagB/SusD family nutrient uptake outer membrane protein [Chitinophaga flava]